MKVKSEKARGKRTGKKKTEKFFSLLPFAFCLYPRSRMHFPPFPVEPAEDQKQCSDHHHGQHRFNTIHSLKERIGSGQPRVAKQRKEEASNEKSNDRRNNVRTHIDLQHPTDEGDRCAWHDGNRTENKENDIFLPSPLEMFAEMFQIFMRDADVFSKARCHCILKLVAEHVEDPRTCSLCDAGEQADPENVRNTESLYPHDGSRKPVHDGGGDRCDNLLHHSADYHKQGEGNLSREVLEPEADTVEHRARAVYQGMFSYIYPATRVPQATEGAPSRAHRRCLSPRKMRTETVFEVSPVIVAISAGASPRIKRCSRTLLYGRGILLSIFIGLSASRRLNV